MSTIGAIFERHGLVRRRRFRRRVATRTRPFSHCREPNDVWCVDFKGQFPTGDGKLCYPLTVMDAASRFLLGVVAFHQPTHDNVRAVFVELFQRYALPGAIRSDSGEPFASTSTAAGFTQLSAWWSRLGIRLERIDPGKPQQNGCVDRLAEHTGAGAVVAGSDARFGRTTLILARWGSTSRSSRIAAHRPR